jgi:hypothetical protein
MFSALNAGAQSAPKYSTLRVQVVDSVGRAALPGAFVSVLGASRSSGADQMGRAQVDSILPGSYAVEVFHPLLDTLGIRLSVPARQFSAGDTVNLAISVPTLGAVSRLKCPDFHSDDEGALTGFVTEANGVDVVADATVTATWLETSIGKEVGIRNSRVIRNTKTGPDGRFVVCNVPTQVAGQIVATQGSRATTPVPLVITGSHFSVQSLAFPEHGDTAVKISGVGGTSTGRVGRASVSGVVLGPEGRPVAGAAVAISGGLTYTQTDSAGRFTLGGAPSGTQTLQVRKIGYEGFERAVTLLPEQTRRVEVTLETFVPVLANVTVRAVRDEMMDRIGFNKRKEAGFGYFVTPEEIDRRNPIRASDLLREIPLLQVTYDKNKAQVSGRGVGADRNCLIYVIDGVQWKENLDDFILPQQIGAIEVYSSQRLPTDVPGAYNTMSCDMAIIWTKAKLMNGIR